MSHDPTNLPKVPESHIDILNGSKAIVSTIRESDRHISTHPIIYHWDGEDLRFSTLKQRVKYRNLLANPQMTICVVCETDFTRYIEFRGTALLEDDVDNLFQRSLWNKLTGKDTFDLDPPGAERVVVTMIPEQISAPLLYGGKLSTPPVGDE
ncbi:Uncharacterised protein [BD1-7 clade bacterium]|uniref:Pyridoxamine 5'-phosphate oxidase N-terminal domain-containing protein n=1 Tax=BD1-7 clade bacterium TaxID=2029982 RepID=A0A5S9N0C8_9GAMM|nr:Uncharacterised protein [BD1-7 clade bacterium]CAA0083034.1 Uncharacterised protein [BD1-7 clade bacterium]